jgi:hypothetical protein
MPYQGQRASKISHGAFFGEELQNFLDHCHYLKTLSTAEHDMVEGFKIPITPAPMSKNLYGQVTVVDILLLFRMAHQPLAWVTLKCLMLDLPGRTTRIF